MFVELWNNKEFADGGEKEYRRNIVEDKFMFL
jgi:hypothetical protein